MEIKNNPPEKDKFKTVPYKLTFVVIWLGATIGNLIMIFAATAAFVGIPPTVAMLQIFNKAIDKDSTSIFILWMLAAVFIASLAFVYIIYNQFAEAKTQLRSKKIFFIGLAASSIFFLVVFAKVCSEAGVCI